MPQLRFITPSFAVAGELTAGDFAKLAQDGVRAVICNRPDGEERGQLEAADAAELAAVAGLAFRHVPAVKFDIFSGPVVAGMAAAIDGVEGPVVAYCKSGLRSALLWATVTAGDQPLEEVLAAVRAAGFELAGLADEIAAAAPAAARPVVPPAGSAEEAASLV